MSRRQLLIAAALWVLCFVGSLIFKTHKGGLVAVISETSFLGLVALTVWLITAGILALRHRRTNRTGHEVRASQTGRANQR